MTEITMRAPEEIEAMCEEFFARLWYHRSLMFAADGKDSPKAEEARQRVALDYPIVLWDMEAGPEIPRGWMLGVVQALRWVLGDGERVEDASRDT
jgi:hypothetical protein